VVPKIALVTDQMFPKPMLPESAAVFGGASFGQVLGAREAGGTGVGDMTFNQTPAGREVGVTFRQGPDGVQVIRQQHGSVSRTSKMASRKAVRTCGWVNSGCRCSVTTVKK